MEEVSSLILTEFRKFQPEKFYEIFPPPRTDPSSNHSEETQTKNLKSSEPWDEESGKNDTVDGKTWFRKQFPECLQGGKITPGKPLYLYQIRFKRLNDYFTRDGRRDEYSENPISESQERKRDFGILSHKALLSVAPFTIYERAPKDLAAEQKVKVNYTVVGVIEVTVFLIKSMIILDKRETQQLSHFHRVNTILHNGYGDINADFCDNKNNKSLPRSHPSENYGELHFLYVPLRLNNLPWTGFDLDWSLIVEMEYFEYRMQKIQQARYVFIFKTLKFLI